MINPKTLDEWEIEATKLRDGGLVFRPDHHYILRVINLIEEIRSLQFEFVTNQNLAILQIKNENARLLTENRELKSGITFAVEALKGIADYATYDSYPEDHDRGPDAMGRAESALEVLLARFPS